MKKLFVSILALSLAAVSYADGNKTVEVNTKVSSIDWVGKKVTGQHEGTISVSGGTLNLENGMISGGEIDIDMSSIAVTDLEGEYKGKLEGHLNSDDFFSVASHPSAKFVINKVTEAEGKDRFNIEGKLTIKGITKAISFPATIKTLDGKIVAVGEAKVDRTLYDIKYGSGKFFEGLGDKMIDDEFLVKFKIGASS